MTDVKSNHKKSVPVLVSKSMVVWELQVFGKWSDDMETWTARFQFIALADG